MGTAIAIALTRLCDGGKNKARVHIDVNQTHRRAPLPLAVPVAGASQSSWPHRRKQDIRVPGDGPPEPSREVGHAALPVDTIRVTVPVPPGPDPAEEPVEEFDDEVPVPETDAVGEMLEDVPDGPDVPGRIVVMVVPRRVMTLVMGGGGGEGGAGGDGASGGVGGVLVLDQ